LHTLLLTYATVTLHTLLTYAAVTLHTLLSDSAITLHTLLSDSAVTLHTLLTDSAVTLHTLLSDSAVNLHTLLTYATVTLENWVSPNVVPMSPTVPGPVSFPGTPIAIKILFRYSLIIPRSSSPPMIPVIIPPTLIKIYVKTWSFPVITPPSVIVMGSVPTPIPGTPPPTAGEEYLFLHIRYGVDIRIR
jgi:hypothetical protein